MNTRFSRKLLCLILSVILAMTVLSVGGIAALAAGGHSIDVNCGVYEDDGMGHLNLTSDYGGTANANKASAASGNLIKITVNLVSGYRVRKIVWGDGAVDYGDITESRQFTMVDEDVCVDVFLEKIPTYTVYFYDDPSNSSNYFTLEVEQGKSLNAPECPFTPPKNKVFDCWDAGPKRPKAGEPYTPEGDNELLYACYKTAPTEYELTWTELSGTPGAVNDWSMDINGAIMPSSATRKYAPGTPIFVGLTLGEGFVLKDGVIKINNGTDGQFTPTLTSSGEYQGNITMPDRNINLSFTAVKPADKHLAWWEVSGDENAVEEARIAGKVLPVFSSTTRETGQKTAFRLLLKEGYELKENKAKLNYGTDGTFNLKQNSENTQLYTGSFTMPDNDVGVSFTTIDPVQAFVRRLYRTCLGHEPDQAGWDNWVSQLKAKKITGIQAARGFVFSQEFQNLNLCNEHYVRRLYQALMGREADGGGLLNWMEQLSKGKSREEVFNGFALSPEFTILCGK